MMTTRAAGSLMGLLALASAQTSAPAFNTKGSDNVTVVGPAYIKNASKVAMIIDDEPGVKKATTKYTLQGEEGAETIRAQIDIKIEYSNSFSEQVKPGDELDLYLEWSDPSVTDPYERTLDLLNIMLVEEGIFTFERARLYSDEPLDRFAFYVHHPTTMENLLPDGAVYLRETKVGSGPVVVDAQASTSFGSGDGTWHIGDGTSYQEVDGEGEILVQMVMESSDQDIVEKYKAGDAAIYPELGLVFVEPQESGSVWRQDSQYRVNLVFPPVDWAGEPLPDSDYDFGDEYFQDTWDSSPDTIEVLAYVAISLQALSCVLLCCGKLKREKDDYERAA